MQRIKVLSPEVRGKIAAGEVIQRPVSVIKELLENSLDAHAQNIDVEIEDGGKCKCLVNDNGMGMSREDAVLAIKRYATSKIQTIDDIENIMTYGFRGEALASIAQVSHFELETSDNTQGTKIEVIAGELKGTFDSHRPTGTRIKVSNLFFNLPARLKFLKSAEWERRLILETVRSYALIAPQVGFNLNDERRSLLSTAKSLSISERLRQMFPKNFFESLLEFEQKIGPTTISGFFSKPLLSENHHFNYCYVNYRPVRYPRIYRTIAEAYENPKNPPAFLLNIQVEPQFVDVNIHPTKNEVKFKDERYILDLLKQLIKKEVFSKHLGFGYEPRLKYAKESSPIKVGEPKSETRFVQDSIIDQASTPTTELSAGRDTGEFWQLHNTYILAQTKSGLIIIDQHVAHERIIYESVMKDKPGGQRLLFPITLELSPEEHKVYKATRAILSELGVEFKEFSHQTIVIDSLPTNAQINREDYAKLFSEIGALGNLMKDKSALATVIACHSAIKAGQKLSPQEMQELIDKLFACENPYTCPHGRPVVVRFTLEDLASKFGRE